MNYEKLFQSLTKNNIRYVVCGGLAVNLHGIPRMTADIDIILDWQKENIDAFQKCIDEVKYKLSLPVSLNDLINEESRRQLIENKNLVALSFYNYDKNFLTLDVIIDFSIPFKELWSRRMIRENESVKINLVSIDDLIKLKEFSNRLQDQQDIFLLSKIKNGK